MSIEVAYLRGHIKSGTNWLCNLLNLHPNVSCKGEFHFEHMHKGYRDTMNAQFSFLNRKPSKFKNAYFKFIQDLVKLYCAEDNKDVKVVIDRTPQAIGSTFIPNSKYLYITRDGRDVIVSWTYHCLRIGIHSNKHIKSLAENYKSNPNYYEHKKKFLLNDKAWVKHAAKMWNNRIVKDFEMKSKIDSGKLIASLYWVKYENLHKNVDYERKKIYAFLGVDPNLASELSDLTKPGFANKKTDNTSFYRAGKIGKWRSYFTKEQHSWFIEETKQAFEILELDQIY